MNKPTTIGKLLLKHSVPEHLKPFMADNTLDKKKIGEFFSKLVEGSEDTYKDTVQKLSRLGFEVATRQGSTVPMVDLSPLDNKEELFDAFEKKLSDIDTGTGTKSEKEIKKIEQYGQFTNEFEKALMDAGTKKNHTLSKVITAGARGTLSQYRQTVGSVILLNDEKGRPMTNFPIRHSFAEGLSVPEYLLHSYGTRTGAIGTKLAIADSGYFSKQLSRAAMPLKIEEHDCGTDNGIPVDVSDKESIGTFLAHPVASYKKNNVVDAKMLADLKDKGIKRIVVRSPITCLASRKSHAWAICQLCAGHRENHHALPPLNSYIGLTAATALGEPLSQGQLNSKHTGSAAALGKNVASGFKLIQQLANIPHTFQNKAAVAAADGHVDNVRALPQGGSEIIIGTQKYYVPAGFPVHVKVGDSVEAGDIISDGIVNPSEIIEHKGIGEGRRYYTEAMRNTFSEAGMGVNRRNFEIIARGAIDHVRVTHPDGLGEYLPDAIVSYQSIEKNYKPRPDAKLVRVDLARGKYLEEPILHFTIGTRVTSRMQEELKEHKIEAVHVHDNPPHFVPEMQRLLDVPANIPDWAHQLNSSYLEKRLINAVYNGMTSSTKGPSPVLGLAYGVGFGEKHAEEDSADEIH